MVHGDLAKHHAFCILTQIANSTKAACINHKIKLKQLLIFIITASFVKVMRLLFI